MNTTTCPTEHGYRWMLCFGGGVDLTVTGIPREAVQNAASLCGAVVTPCSIGQPSSASQVEVWPANPGLRPDCLALSPGERVACRKRAKILVYFRDGWVRYADSDIQPQVHLFDVDSPTLDGAFGNALFRKTAERGALLLHAAAIDLKGFSILVLGDSGAGKSTLCAASLALGARVVSDDLLLICQGQQDPRPTAHAMRQNAYFSAETRALLPAAIQSKASYCDTRRKPKYCLVRQDAPDAFRSRATIDLIVILPHGPHPRRTSSWNADQGNALSAIVAASPLLHHGGQTSTRRMLSTAQRVATTTPALTLAIGSELMNDPSNELRRLIESLRDRTRAAKPAPAEACSA